MMRLCVVSGTFHPEPGGPPTYLYHLLPALIQRGHSVSVITYGEVDQHDPGVYPYPVTRITRQISIPGRLLAFTWAVLREGHRADVLFVSDYGLPAAVANLTLRKPLVMKIVSDFAWEFAARHGWTDLPVIDFQSAHQPMRVRVLRAVERWYARQAHAIIVPSQHVGRLVQGWGMPDTRLRVIYNALPTSNVESLRASSRQVLRHELGWPDDEPTFVTVGRVAEVKRVDLQLQALAKLPHGRLVIVGEGPEMNLLQDEAERLGIAERVTFTGVLPHQHALHAIRAADVFVLSSRTEGLSHVLLEAMQLGTPCIASNVGGNPEIITSGVSGFLVPFGDIEALAAAMRTLGSDPALRAQLAEAAGENMQRFSWKTLVDRTEALLQEFAHV